MLRFLWVLAFSSAAFAQVQVLRVTAGEARSFPREERLGSIFRVRIEPPLDFPPVVGVDDSGAIRVTVPPATPRGEYRMEIGARAEDGSLESFSLTLTVDAVTVGPPTSGKPPVVLLNGFQLSCPTNPDSTLASAAGTFGQLPALLQSDGLSVVFFNNCVYGAGAAIEALATQLKSYLGSLTYTDGSPVTQVDLVAHSMGGLIARAYLAGLQADGSLNPPPSPGIRKFIQLATPNFGSYQANLLSGTQTTEMTPGSLFLWNLATWNQRGDDLRGVDALAVIGNAGTETQANQSDGLVSLTSGSLGFARADERTRIVPYCHITSSGLIAQVIHCTGQGIADVDSPAHFSARIVRSFLADTTEWKSIGTPPSGDAFLSQYGGVFFSAAAANGSPIGDLTQASLSGAALTKGGDAGAIFYDEFLQGAGTFQTTSASLGGVSCGSFTAPPGHYTAFRCKSGPVITSVGPALRGAAHIVLAGQEITIHGKGFGTGGFVDVTGGGGLGLVLPVLSWSDQSITVSLPYVNGLLGVGVNTSAGADGMWVIIAPPGSPWLPSRPPRGAEVSHR
jgi:pimeloyl-ACP methyl ester carboxylesterase